jgi:hypothetical protein
VTGTRLSLKSSDLEQCRQEQYRSLSLLFHRDAAVGVVVFAPTDSGGVSKCQWQYRVADLRADGAVRSGRAVCDPDQR